MAYIRLNTKDLHLDVLVGACETYKPKKEIKKIVEELQVLKDSTEEYLTTNWGEKKTEEYKVLFDSDEKESEKWQKYVKEQFSPKLEDIINRVNELNKHYQKK